MCRFSRPRQAPSTRSVWIVCFCAALIASLSATAGIGEGDGEIGFDLGSTGFDSNTSDEDGTRLVIRGGYHFNDLFQLEGQLATSEADEFFGDITLSTLTVNAVFNFHPREHIVPYAFAGIGNANLEVDSLIDDDSFATQIGGGSRFFVGQKKKMAVRVELSFLSEETFDESSTHTNLDVGLTWRLGS